MIAIMVSAFALLCILGAIFEPKGRTVELAEECHEHAWPWIDELEAWLTARQEEQAALIEAIEIDRPWWELAA
tara:strand:+ start:549 stop:767 length:219 start_codon:yes stop_codon:yes gene_type:complete